MADIKPMLTAREALEIGHPIIITSVASAGYFVVEVKGPGLKEERVVNRKPPVIYESVQRIMKTHKYTSIESLVGHRLIPYEDGLTAYWRVVPNMNLFTQWTNELDKVAKRNGFSPLPHRSNILEDVWKPLYLAGLSPAQAWKQV